MCSPFRCCICSCLNHTFPLGSGSVKASHGVSTSSSVYLSESLNKEAYVPSTHTFSKIFRSCGTQGYIARSLAFATPARFCSTVETKPGTVSSNVHGKCSRRIVPEWIEHTGNSVDVVLAFSASEGIQVTNNTEWTQTDAIPEQGC